MLVQKVFHQLRDELSLIRVQPVDMFGGFLFFDIVKSQAPINIFP